MTFAAQQLAARVRAHRSIGLAARRRRVPRSRPPRLIEADYAGRLVAIIDRMRAVMARLLPGILAGLPRADGARVDASDAARGRREVERARIEIEDAINVTQLEGVASEMGRRTAAHQAGEIQRQARAALGVDVVLLDLKVPSLIDGFVHENVKLIGSLKNRTLDELENIVARAYASGTRAAAVGEEIAARFGIAERHARLIARDQIGKLNGQVTAARHRELGIASFVWRSMRDRRVRPRHAHLDGQRFAYDKPPADGLPGQPIACRCTQEPVFDDLIVAAAPAAGARTAQPGPAVRSSAPGRARKPARRARPLRAGR